MPWSAASTVWSLHPNHLSVIKESVLLICEDIMAIDWVAQDLHGPVKPPLARVRVAGDHVEAQGEVGQRCQIRDFGGVGEINAVDSNQEVLNLQKEKVRDYLQSMVVVDYVCRCHNLWAFSEEERSSRGGKML
ncbi:hypothetical protein FNV43_RR08825 [Rhamnella rubrinervis]|uniref:Uncharacterized protein n=1 Tax=Rhamnella rubrinervis TaxID=2594499 RepID=A0A8K0MJQ7_9ROSA|nr:hypothetical protein FNV43_RR08825 [Rhamnella rubrinervis]